MVNPAKSGPELVFINNLLLGYPVEDNEMGFKNDIDKKIIEWMRRSYTDKSLDLRAKSSKDLICILLDIILYEDSVMVTSAFTLLAKYFSQKRSIIYFANEVQLLQDDQEVTIFKKVLH